MPKRPILSRECFYDVLGDGSFRMLDWNLVNTELGAMVEPRSISIVPANGRVVQIDLKDASFNRITEFDEDKFIRFMGTGGRLIPVDFNL